MKKNDFDSLGKFPHKYQRICISLGYSKLRPSLFAFLLLLTLPFAHLIADQLQEARVSQVIKDVKLLPAQAAPRPAHVSDDIRNGTAVRTGLESRAELTFTDQTLARLGANTIFTFDQGTRKLELGSGAMLLRVPKNAGGAQINTAAITAAITGTTVMLEFHPNAYIKFIILEGTGRIFRNDRVGESVLVHAGQMLIVNPNGKGLPDPVDVDLKRLMQTSLLINGFGPLASDDLIARVISAQSAEKNDGGLIETNLVIFGGGTAVNLLDPTYANTIDQANSNEERQPTPPPATPTPPPITPTPPPGKYGTLTTISTPNPYVINSGTTIQTDPNITNNGVTDYGKIYRGQALDGLASDWAFGSTSAFDISSGFDNQIGPSSGAAFKFTALQLTGNPTIDTTNGQINLGLIAVNGITSGGPGGVLTFAGIRGLLLATVNGPITLGPEISFSIMHDLTIYARGANSDLMLGSDIDTGSNVYLYAERDIIATSNITTDEFIAVAGRDISISEAMSGVSGIQATTMSFNAGNNINIGGAFDTDETAVDSSGDVTLAAGNDIASSGGIDITRTNGGQTDGLNVILDAGNDLTVGTSSIDNLAITVDNSGGQLNTGGNIDLVAGGNLTVMGDASFIVENTGGSIGTGGNISVTAGGDLTAGSLLAFVNNRNGGSIDSGGNITFSIGGALSTQFDAQTGDGAGDSLFLLISNRNDGSGGGTIGSDVILSLDAASVSVAGNMFAGISTNFGGVVPSARVDINIAGDLFIAGNAADADTFGVVEGGDFDIENAGTFTVDGAPLPGGTIGTDATVALSANNITGSLLLEILNGGSLGTNGQIAPGGTIGADATVTLTAADISGDSAFLYISNRRGGRIGTDATINLSAASILSSAVDGSTGASIINYAGGNIGGNALISFNVAGDIDTQGDAFFQILNVDDDSGLGGGAIGSDATINVSAASLSAASLTALINNTGGTIGGNASIDFALTGTLTTTGDASFTILGSSLTTPGAAIIVSADSFDVGGSLIANVSDNGSFFNLENVTINATNGITVGDQLLVQGNVTAGRNVSAVNDIDIGGDLSLTTDATGVANGADLAVNSGGDTTIGGAFNINIFSTSGTLGNGGNISVNTGGQLTAGDLSFTLDFNMPGVTVTDGANVILTVGGDLNAASLLAEVNNSTGGNIGTGGNILVTTGGDLVTTSGGAAFTIQNTDGTISNGGNLTLTVSSNLVTQTLTLFIENFDFSSNAAGHIGTGGNLFVTAGADLTADSVDALINNRSGGTIDSGGSMFFNIGGGLTTTGDAGFYIGNRLDSGQNGFMLGSVIGSDVSLEINAGSVDIGGSLASPEFSGSGISNKGGTIDGSATYTWNVSGDMTIQGDAFLYILNDVPESPNPTVAGTIHGSASIQVNAANLTAGSLEVFLANAGGVIDSDATINLAIAGNLISQTDADFDIINNYTSRGNRGGSIGQDATISVAANSLSAASLLAGIYNSGGSIVGGSNISFKIGGALSTTTGDATFQIFDNDNGYGSGPGAISSDATIDVIAANISTGGSLNADIFNYSGGDIGGSANINFNLTGDLTSPGDVMFSLDNSSGGTIGQDAIVSVNTSGNINAQGNAIFNILNSDFSSGSGAGTIVGGATVNVSAASITVGPLFAQIANLGSNIDGNGAINVLAPNGIISGGDASITIFNADNGDGGPAGTIGGDATINVNAGDISIAGSLENAIYNTFVESSTVGTISGNATLTFAAGAVTIQDAASFKIDSNDGAEIGGNATINLNATSLSVDGPTGLLVHIINFNGGTIGQDALIDFGIAGDVNVQSDATLQILNNDGGLGGGTIGGSATINVAAANITTNSLLAQIVNNGGTIGGDATINMNVSGNATVTGDATVQILGSDGAASAATNINGGGYDAGGTFLALTDGDGTIAFNNASVHADVLKVGALGANGVLNIGGGSLSADTTLELYASGSNGNLNFISNVTLGGNGAKILAANSVTIFNNVVVTIGGSNPADVYTGFNGDVPNANYTGSGGNGSTTGTFGGAGANNPQPLSNAPPFGPSSPATSTTDSDATARTTIPPLPSSAIATNTNVTSGKRTSTAIRIDSTDELLSLLDGAAPGSGGRITIPVSKSSRNLRNSSRMAAKDRSKADRGAVSIRPGHIR